VDVLEIASFTDGQILRETAFRQALDQYDWAKHAGKAVILQGCSKMLIPTWAFCVVTARLTGVADRIYFGEQKTRIPIYDRSKHQEPRTENPKALVDAGS